MSQDEFDDIDQKEEIASSPAKKKFDFEKFQQQWNTLDPNNMGGWPISVKITIWIFTFVFVGLLGYFLLIQSTLTEISNAQAQETNLLNEFREKDSKLRNLQQYQAQILEMQNSFDQQLKQLPKETEIPGLVEDINVTGVKAGLKLKNILLEPEVTQEFFIEQPISIEANGDYHAFGSFVSGVAALPRIVTLHDFSVTATPDTEKKSDLPVISYKINAKTYRYAGTSATTANAPQEGAAQ